MENVAGRAPCSCRSCQGQADWVAAQGAALFSPSVVGRRPQNQMPGRLASHSPVARCRGRPAHACRGPTTHGSPPQALNATRRLHGGLTAASSPSGRAPAPPPPVLRPFSGRETADWLLHCYANARLWGSVGWAASDSTWAHVTSSGRGVEPAQSPFGILFLLLHPPQLSLSLSHK